MVLDSKTIEQIKAFVYEKPRTINEIALLLGKNWRTAHRYVEQIMLKTGSIKTRTFREGTRGSLRVVYWNVTDKVYATDVQEELFTKIERGIDKSDFSPFDLYQYIDPEYRDASYCLIDDESNYDFNIGALFPFFNSSKKEISIFAGNLSFIHLKHKKKTMLGVIKECVKRGVFIRLVTNVRLNDGKNVEELLSVNRGLKEPLLEIRHSITPLRAYIFDEEIVRLGEIIPSQQKPGQFQKTAAVYYEIRDKTWVEWLSKIFFKRFQNAIPVKARLEGIQTIRQL